ncbi:hypothetical protein [Actinophytocola sp.]|uniref:hypothetical protein n=1 Tax=Actinophytocola sp. TaxID=1872138 RepID=UPI002D80141B|nr:hypothetical protein [Actinophytocola sp.]HET9142717.1 hypothetical protein [Actinophytocola sp.]
MVNVPGSGALSQQERILVARVHTMVEPTPDTMMFKVLPAGALRVYLGNLISTAGPGELTLDCRTAGGYVARVVDAEDLRTPAAFIKAFHWDYPTVGFPLNASRIHVMEFPAGPVDWYSVPLGAPAHPDPSLGLHHTSPQVRQVADEMVAAGEAAGIDPARIERVIDYWPYTGTGMTPNALDGLPVWRRRYHALPAGTMIFEYDTQGTKNPVAHYQGQLWGWKDLR